MPRPGQVSEASDVCFVVRIPLHVLLRLLASLIHEARITAQAGRSHQGSHCLGATLRLFVRLFAADKHSHQMVDEAPAARGWRSRGWMDSETAVITFVSNVRCFNADS